MTVKIEMKQCLCDKVAVVAVVDDESGLIVAVVVVENAIEHEGHLVSALHWFEHWVHEAKLVAVA